MARPWIVSTEGHDHDAQADEQGGAAWLASSRVTF
jgi:hypothetical protein